MSDGSRRSARPEEFHLAASWRTSSPHVGSRSARSTVTTRRRDRRLGHGVPDDAAARRGDQRAPAGRSADRRERAAAPRAAPAAVRLDLDRRAVHKGRRAGADPGSADAADVEGRGRRRSAAPRNSWPRIRHQAGMSTAAAGSSASTRTTAPTGSSGSRRASAITGSGQRWPRQSSTSTGVGHSPTTPASARRSATMPGSSARNRSTSSSVVSRCSETRTLPCVSTPIASSTCSGAASTTVHDEPDETAKPRRSSACSSASPSTYRQEKVTRCGSRSHRVADHLDVGHRRRDRGPDPVDQRRTAGPPRPPRSAARRAQRRRRGHDRRQVQRARGTAGSRSSAGYGDSQRVPLRTTSTPTPGGPPHLCALAGQQRPAGRHRHPADRLGGVDVAAAPRPSAHAGGRLGDRLHRADLVTGADQRGQRHPGRRDRRGQASRSSRPSRSTGTAVGAAAARRAARRRAAPPSARSPSAPASARPGAGRPGRPSTAACAAVGAAGGEGQLVGAYAEDLGDAARGRVEQLAGPAGLACRACPGRPSRRRARPAAPAAPPGAAARRWPRRGRPAHRRGSAVFHLDGIVRYQRSRRCAGHADPRPVGAPWSSSLRPSVTPCRRCSGRTGGAAKEAGAGGRKEFEPRGRGARPARRGSAVGGAALLALLAGCSATSARRSAASAGPRAASPRRPADVRPVDRLGRSRRWRSASSSGA